MEILSTYIDYLQYDDPKKDLDEINKVLEIAKEELKEFKKFQKLYPNHSMQKPYNELITAITRATSWAAGSYSEDLKSTKDTTIKTDKDTVKNAKLALEKIIKNNKINSPEAIKFLTNKRTYFKKANEYDYLIKKYLEAKNTINWKKDNLDKYFDNIYAGLTDFYTFQRKYEASIDVLNEGLKIAENNYENLYFKSAYSEFSTGKMFSLMMFKTETFLNESENFIKALSRHVSHLESLSPRDKERMLEIDDDYYLDVLLCLYLFDILGMEIPDKINKTTYYPLKQLDFIKANNKKYDFIFEYPVSLSSLLQASIIDDDLKNFNFANNELAILFSKSAGDPKKLSAIRSTAPMIISAYESNGFYLKSDNFIKFVEDVFTLDEQIKNNPTIREQFVLFSHYQAQSAIRNNNIEKAKKIYETGFEYSKPNIKNFLNYTLYDVIVGQKYVPELYEIYFNEKNYKKLNRVNRSFISNDISNLSKKDLKYISYLDLNSYKIFKIYLKYFEEKNDIKKFKMVKSHIIKKLDKTIKQLKKNDKREFINMGTSRDLVLREITEIAQILINNSYKTEGTEILNKIYPIIINYFKEKSATVVWKPNIEDNVFGLIYLDIAENYLKSDKSFIKKAYKVAQIGKNVFTSRDLNKAISMKKFKDPDGLIEKYEKIQRELTVNLRSAQFAPKEVAGNTKISEELNNKNRKFQNEMEQLERDIEKKIPSYFKLTKIQTAKISELQKLLKKDEVLLDYYFYEKELKVVSISKDKVEILSKKNDFNYLNKLNKELRNTLIPSQGTIKPYAVNKSFILNEKTFLFLNKITKNYKNIIVIPDGPLNSMPLHALAYAKNENCLDCRNIKFNLSKHNFNYFPSADSFTSIETIAKDFKKTKYLLSKEKIKIPFKKIKEKIGKLVKKDKSSKLKKVEINNLFYLGIGDPDLYSKIESTKISEEDKITMLRSLFDTEVINSEIIKEIYGPVDGSADEIEQVAKYLSPLKSKLLLREDAKELNLKELDLSSYKIIHFATHGEISGALEGINEPFLVLSPPSSTSNEDGLLTMSEIMSLDTNADLVVLSACNTASGDEIGSEGFSGLAKSFFMSGSKSILVSNWYVETYSAKEIVINLFKNIKNNNNLTVSKALNLAMLDMAKNQKDRSHPLFWAPFVVVGKNQSLSF
jgi:CHAT domain-containing protein